MAQAKASASHREPILRYNPTIVADRIFYHFCQRVLTKAGEVKDQERAYKAAQAVANWLTSSDKNKNLNLCGSVGVGKSTILGSLMDFLNETEYQYHKVLVTANKVAEIALCSESSWEILTKKPILLIDDVGTEPYEVKEYGNVYLPFTELLEHRYNRNLTTVITTNLTIADINSKYGARVADRVNEFHTLTFKRDSYRNG